MSVAVLNLGVGNTASMLFALERLGADAVLTDDPQRLADAERIIFPGVGSAGFAAKRLAETGLDQVLRAFPRPLLGVCLGMQMLYEASEEGDAAALGLAPGVVRAVPASPERPSPHMGWNRLLIHDRDEPLLDGVEDDAFVYFVHGFAAPVSGVTAAACEYGELFTAVVASKNVRGCQFHPERSGPVGARILKNFLSLPC